MPLSNCEIGLNLTWSEKCVICEVNRARAFALIDKKLHVPVVTLSTQDNAKLLQELKVGFKRMNNRNKYLLKDIHLAGQNPGLDYLISPIFQGVNRLFVLSFENKRVYYLSKVEMIGYNVRNDVRTYKNRKSKLIKEIIAELVVY